MQNYTELDFSTINNAPNLPTFSATEAQQFSIASLSKIYWPLTQILAVFIQQHRERFVALSSLQPGVVGPTPFLLALTGSVSVGKTSLAHLLKQLLAKALPDLQIECVSTDGFLKKTIELEAEGIMHKKGFPESYNNHLLEATILALKSAQAVNIPIYSHEVYDILPDQRQLLMAPDIVIFEGLNLIQSWNSFDRESCFALDMIDYTILLDAELEDISHWYVERFLQQCEKAEKNPTSFYVQFLSMSHEQRLQFAKRVWQEINALNYQQNIAPFKHKADMIIEKNRMHEVVRVSMKRV